MADGSREAPRSLVFWDRREEVEGNGGQYKLTITQPSLAHLVRIEADGHQPAVSREFNNNEGNVTCDFALHKGKDLNVMVRLPDGKPAAGADVCLCPEERDRFTNMAVVVRNGRFANWETSGPHLEVGPDGRLQIQPQDDGFLLIVAHDRGFAQTTSEELAAKAEITLTAWARLEGEVRHGAKPVPGAKLDVFSAGSDGMRWAFLNFRDQTETDADGKFVFPKLKPGRCQVRRLPASQDQVARPSPNGQVVELEAGQTFHLALGGGRPVVGRIEWPGGKPPPGDLSNIGAERPSQVARARAATQGNPRSRARRRPGLVQEMAGIGGRESVADEAVGGMPVERVGRQQRFAAHRGGDARSIRVGSLRPNGRRDLALGFSRTASLCGRVFRAGDRRRGERRALGIWVACR